MINTTRTSSTIWIITVLGFFIVSTIFLAGLFSLKFMQAEATYAIDGFETDKKPRLEEACHKNNGEFYKIINRNKNRSWLIDCRVNNELIEIEVPR